MEKHLYERNRTHFAQAQHTPFATGPLATLFEHDGISATTSAVLAGSLDTASHPDFDPPIPMILAELKQKRPTLTHHIELDPMIKGLHKWREATTTSPSGKHLGIYRTLTRQHIHGSTTPAKTASVRDSAKTEVATKALAIQNMILNLAIMHTHTLERWKVIHNFFLEKLPGRPLLEKLRVIHLYEADWSLPPQHPCLC
jgi:hypothetical protein